MSDAADAITVPDWIATIEKEIVDAQPLHSRPAYWYKYGPNNQDVSVIPTLIYDHLTRLCREIRELLVVISDLRIDKLDGQPVYLVTELIPWNEGEGEILGVYLDERQARNHFTAERKHKQNVRLKTYVNNQLVKEE